MCISVTLGVPQGSFFGTLLYNLFTNDMSSVVTNSCFKMFADDIKIQLIENLILYLSFVIRRKFVISRQLCTKDISYSVSFLVADN